MEIISRDRAGAYAEGARNGAPNAVQVADRFHLLMNVTTAMTRFFERKHDTLKHIYELEKALDPPVPRPVDTDPPAKPLTLSQQQQLSRQARRQNRYDTVKQLHEQGVSQRAIAALVGLHRDTVHRYLQTAQLPDIRRPHRRSKLDPYKDYLHQRWSEGTRNVTHLVAELRKQGYRGSETIVFDYLRPLHEQPEWLPPISSSNSERRKVSLPLLSPRGKRPGSLYVLLPN